MPNEKWILICCFYLFFITRANFWHGGIVGLSNKESLLCSHSLCLSVVRTLRTWEVDDWSSSDYNCESESPFMFIIESHFSCSMSFFKQNVKTFAGSNFVKMGIFCFSLPYLMERLFTDVHWGSCDEHFSLDSLVKITCRLFSGRFCLWFVDSDFHGKPGSFLSWFTLTPAGRECCPVFDPGAAGAVQRGEILLLLLTKSGTQCVCVSSC